MHLRTAALQTPDATCFFSCVVCRLRLTTCLLMKKKVMKSGLYSIPAMLCVACCFAHALLSTLCCACCEILCCACFAVLYVILLCCTWCSVEREESIHCRAALHLIQLQHCRSLDEGVWVGYVNATLLGVKGCLVPYYLPSMEDPHVIVVSLANCTDLAKSH